MNAFHTRLDLMSFEDRAMPSATLTAPPPVPTEGLLLPAVQASREAAGSTPSADGVRDLLIFNATDDRPVPTTYDLLTATNKATDGRPVPTTYDLLTATNKATDDASTSDDGLSAGKVSMSDLSIAPYQTGYQISLENVLVSSATPVRR
jgi:hypothetical protein